MPTRDLVGTTRCRVLSGPVAETYPRGGGSAVFLLSIALAAKKGLTHGDISANCPTVA